MPADPTQPSKYSDTTVGEVVEVVVERPQYASTILNPSYKDTTSIITISSFNSIRKIVEAPLTVYTSMILNPLNPLTLIFLVLITVYGKTNFVKEIFLAVLFATGPPIQMIWTIYKKSKLSYKRDRPFSTRPDSKDDLQKSKLS